MVIVTTSWDDGDLLDVKLADFLMRCGIKGTFYIPLENSERKVLSTQAIRDISHEFEIGGHTRNHKKLTILDDKQIYNEIKGGKSALEDILCCPVHVFSYPWGCYNERVRNAVIDAGFRGARTTQEFWLTLGEDPFLMPTTLQASPHSGWTRIKHAIKGKNWMGLSTFLKMRLGKTFVELARDLFTLCLFGGGLWHLWGHSWEIENLNLWDPLQELFTWITSHTEVEFLTNGQIIKRF
jgi:peptidoglycan/xylan/chitin deacetylase (PgdA/CDA1 family)